MIRVATTLANKASISLATKAQLPRNENFMSRGCETMMSHAFSGPTGFQARLAARHNWSPARPQNIQIQNDRVSSVK